MATKMTGAGAKRSGGSTVTRARSEIAAEICRRIAAGESTRTVFSVKGRRPDYPDRATFWHWRKDDAEMAKVFMAAMRERALGYAEEIVDISDEITSDRIANERNRLRVDARKFDVSKLLPLIFGDRVTLAGDADNPIRIDDARAAIASKLLPELAAGGTTGATGAAK
jgi:hypothetical protein